MFRQETGITVISRHRLPRPRPVLFESTGRLPSDDDDIDAPTEPMDIGSFSSTPTIVTPSASIVPLAIDSLLDDSEDVVDDVVSQTMSWLEALETAPILRKLPSIA